MKLHSLLAATFLVMLMGATNAQAWGGCDSDRDCRWNEHCVKVPGKNNNYCAKNGYDWSCQSDYDCRRDEHCVQVPGPNNNYCAKNHGGGHGGYGCLQSGASCGNNDSACCSRNCVDVPGKNNNYCQ